ncbi:hypothetical protein IF2G_10870 [Cordyceps javanica]|nr:hypothetical protein IF2G_10870 [Cordyceps javanica]
METNPDSKTLAVAKKFGISRGLLRRRRVGITSDRSQHPANSKLKDAEEDAILKIVIRLDNTNLSVSKSWITSMASALIEERSSANDPSPNFVGQLPQTHSIKSAERKI